MIVARLSACRSACHRNNFRKSTRVSDVSARILARMSVSVSASWNSSLTTSDQPRGDRSTTVTHGVPSGDSSGVVEHLDVDASRIQHVEADGGESELRRAGVQGTSDEQAYRRVAAAARRQRLPRRGAEQRRRHVRLQHAAVGQYHPEIQLARSANVVGEVQRRVVLVAGTLYRWRRSTGACSLQRAREVK